MPTPIADRQGWKPSKLEYNHEPVEVLNGPTGWYARVWVEKLGADIASGPYSSQHRAEGVLLEIVQKYIEE
jgi:hypothetical protein